MGEPRFFRGGGQFVTPANYPPTDAPAAAMFAEYNARFQKRLQGVFGRVDAGSRYFDAYQRLSLNAASFAAAKALMVERLLNQARQEANPVKRDMLTKNILSAYNGRYLQNEEHALQARARSAKQWLAMNDPANRRLFPNLQWIKSRSVTPYEPHRAFWGRIWAKDDPFWDAHQPGDHWGCRCDWQETSDPVTDNAIIYKPSAAKGLQGNPAKTGKAFSEDASYFQALDAGGNWRVHTIITPFLRDIILKEWTPANVPANKGLSVENSNFASGSILINRNSIRSSFAHTNDDMLRVLLPALSKAQYRYRGWSPTDEGKHLDADYFIYYEITLGNKTYYANVKASNNYNREVLYCILDRLPDKINKNQPPNISNYKK